MSAKPSVNSPSHDVPVHGIEKKADAATFENPEVEKRYKELRALPTDEVFKKHQRLSRVRAKYTAAEVGGKQGMIADILESELGRKRMGYAKKDSRTCRHDYCEGRDACRLDVAADAIGELTKRLDGLTKRR